MSQLNRQEMKAVLAQAAQGRRYQWRMAKDGFAKYAIAAGGWSVIFAVLLIFAYLLSVVFPMLIPATMDKTAQYEAPGGGQTLYYRADEYKETALRMNDRGDLVVFDWATGQVTDRLELQGLDGARLIKAMPINNAKGTYGLVDDRGRLAVVEHGYTVSYPSMGERVIKQTLNWPYGEAWFSTGVEQPDAVVVRKTDSALIIAAAQGNRVLLTDYGVSINQMTEEVDVELNSTAEISVGHAVDFLQMSGDAFYLYAINRSGQLSFFNVRNAAKARLIDTYQTTSPGISLTGAHMLLGDISLMLTTQTGGVSQWFPVRSKVIEGEVQLARIRGFESQKGAIASFAPESGRKAFALGDDQGVVGLYHATAQRTVLLENVAQTPISTVYLSPRHDGLLVETQGQVQAFDVHNEHPEISLSALWGKVWYEGYQEPEHVWQSSASSNDFEPKLSLAPLTFGTLKAAFYAMLMGMPLAIMAAIYTAFFMSSSMRAWVKPTIEVMEALPTVILGFLAGLWLAPMMEANLSGFFSILFVLPIGILGFAALWMSLPEHLRNRVPAGWYGALLVPVVLVLGIMSFEVGGWMESAFFGGSMRDWISNDLGITYDQRNAMVVGFAMGFAVIPTIFSITEDAIFSVPKHLVNGSLALGASMWQTLTGVVLPTASPGIFSATMIGFGRAVGETMIVLMATGNTPVMEMNIFEGMRTLAANIAVEMPESELGSTHYRILFLAALVLFIFTFFFNTLAEVVRQRLRKKYGSL
jgi:phosphate transport system permease protein